ncbi:cobalamin-5-phosphate synthase CobS [Vulcanisaeta moutnovskia 768-28]|uniref:Adenosylcobinamide-GDP ribazoletransferase n=1 Tax=Vulcanisaeta moutnovskia (strain 768-28) TaxID=985053 RepID=F0QSJ7_VULM7|nr:adenosylcobinamide-GDP ribazoletransferase [Vulcanisaeta moutnovskia]ADY00348.1 cobalamin-5-phosphate synthase CobS [Vulcanisaeta moutnovskia 768-28]
MEAEDFIDDLRAVITFFTIVPIGGSHDISRALKNAWLAIIIVPPITGLLPGLLGYYLSLFVHNNLLTASITYLLLLVLTGLNHIDGFADVIDALMVRVSIEDRIRILKDPHRGSASIAMVVLLIIMAISALTNLAGILWQSLLIAEIMSKSTCCLCGIIGKEPSYKGLGWQLTRYSREKAHLIIMAIIIGLIITYLLLGPIGIVISLGSMALSTLLFIALQRSFGGAVGDLYGFTLEISRVITLVLMASIIIVNLH